jgi:hypothetical protein
MSASASTSSKPFHSLTMRERLSTLMKHREEEIECLKPNFGAVFHYGGAHRCWVIQSALMTADAIIAYLRSMPSSDSLSAAIGGGVSVSHLLRMAIPLPSKWGGKRPAEFDTDYGHTASTGKDWRHFENGLRYKLWEAGYFSNVVSIDDRKGIAIEVIKIVDVAKNGGVRRLDAAEFNGKPYNFTASTPDYDGYISAKIAEFQNDD